MAARRDEDGTRLARYTKQQKELPVGTAVTVQNQTGRNPTKLDKTGIILENKKHSQVVVRKDGSRRATLRNRRFVKQILPPVRDCVPRPTPAGAPVQMVDQPRQQPQRVEGHQGAGQERAQVEVRQVPNKNTKGLRKCSRYQNGKCQNSLHLHPPHRIHHCHHQHTRQVRHCCHRRLLDQEEKPSLTLNTALSYMT